MASYVPPHKRLSRNQVVPPPTPVLMDPQMTDKHVPRVMKFAYAHHSISRCLAVPLQDDGQIPSSVHLVPISSESFICKAGERPFTLVDDHAQQDCHLKRPWVSVAEKVHSDLLSTFQNVKDEMAKVSLGKITPQVMVRFGKVIFPRSLDHLRESSLSEARLRNLRSVLYNDVPISYMEHIKNEVVPEIGMDFGEKKDEYLVKLSDTMRPGSFITCKCRKQEGEQKLELYRIDSVQMRHLIVDVSCLDSHVDLRLALQTKRDLTAVNDEEKQIIGDLISSAILDPNVKGAVKWPIRVADSGARYTFISVWHTKDEFFSNSSMELRVREANRFDFPSSTGSITREVSLNLTGIARNLMEVENDAVSTMLEDTLKIIWEHFLKWDGSIVSYSES